MLARNNARRHRWILLLDERFYMRKVLRMLRVQAVIVIVILLVLIVAIISLQDIIIVHMVQDIQVHITHKYQK